MEETDKAKPKKHAKKIKVKSKALTLFNIANLALMANVGTIGMVRAIVSYSGNDDTPSTWPQIITEFSTLIVTTLLVFLAIAANNIDKTKKHDQITLEAHNLEKKDKIGNERKESIQKMSKTVAQIDKTITIFTSSCGLLFFVCGFIGIIEKASSGTTAAAVYDIVAYMGYVLAVSLTLMKNNICDKLHSRIEKLYFKEKSDPVYENKATFMNKLSSAFYRFFKNGNSNAKDLSLEK